MKLILPISKEEFRGKKEQELTDYARECIHVLTWEPSINSKAECNLWLSTWDTLKNVMVVIDELERKHGHPLQV